METPLSQCSGGCQNFHRIGQSVGQMPPEWVFFHRATPVVGQKFTGHRIGQSVSQMPPEWVFFSPGHSGGRSKIHRSPGWSVGRSNATGMDENLKIGNIASRFLV